MHNNSSVTPQEGGREAGREGRMKRGRGREWGGREGCSAEKRSKEGGWVDRRVGVQDGERDDRGRE